VTRSPKDLGRWGEALAAEYLLNRGYTIIARNEHTPYGEIDLIAQQASQPDTDPKEAQGVTVFVEVKTRTSKKFGYPEQSVTAHKRENMVSSAQYYLQEHSDKDIDWRIDVIAIEQYGDQKPIIRHFENALS
jgi:putative endonuclease